MTGEPSCDSFSSDDPASCRIETRGGTVYWLSAPDENGSRWVLREQLKLSETETLVVPLVDDGSDPDLGDKFRASLGADVTVGGSLVLAIEKRTTRLVSEPVVAIEVGNIPAMVFG